MIFESPAAFFLLLLVPVYYALHFRQKRVNTAFSAVSLLAQLPASPKQRLYRLLPIFRILALVLLTVAIARPREILGKKKQSSDGIAIELVVDRSSSMDHKVNFEGETVNRLELVKRVLKNFVLGNSASLKGRPNDLIGMISFARYGDTVCPLVRNPEAVGQFIDALQLAQVRAEDGTAIGDALMLAASRLHQAEKDLKQQLKQGFESPIELQSKIIILLTDGSNNAGQISPQQAALKAKEWGVKIYTIGLSEAQNKSIWSFGSGVDEDLLKAMADHTGGQYFKVQSPDQLSKVYTEIDQLEQSRVELAEYARGKELYGFWGMLAALLLVLEWFLNATWLRRAS
jgi:Ca-activated chloride channel homolog